jgi:uncharacterized RDD family membrane protein YckC
MPRPTPSAESSPPPNPETPTEPAPRPYYPGQPGSQYNYVPPAGGYAQPGAYPGNYGQPGPQPGYPYAAQPVFVPAYAPVQSYPYNRVGTLAGFWVRAGAWLIDSIIVGLLFVLIAGIPQIFYWTGFATKYTNEIAAACPNTSYYDAAAEQRCNDVVESIFLQRGELNSILGISIGFGMLALLLSLVYYVGMTAYGATIGKKVFGLKVVKENGDVPGFGVALLRQTIGYWVSGAIFDLGFLWVAFDDKKQGWHDKICQTYVVRA